VAPSPQIRERRNWSELLRLSGVEKDMRAPLILVLFSLTCGQPTHEEPSTKVAADKPVVASDDEPAPPPPSPPPPAPKCELVGEWTIEGTFSDRKETRTRKVRVSLGDGGRYAAVDRHGEKLRVLSSSDSPPCALVLLEDDSPTLHSQRITYSYALEVQGRRAAGQGEYCFHSVGETCRPKLFALKAALSP